ncbi:hypothetical protein [Methanosarcina sp.]|uniref:hypothetical protein n=1 Tax=Methanosarcina sp. TaxID=2213 RepID=UPI003C740193
MEEEKRFDAEVYQTGSSIAWNILAHGFRGNAKTWKKQIDFFSKYYNLLVLEMHRRKDNEDLHLDKVCKFIDNTLNHYKIKSLLPGLFPLVH